MMAGQWPAIGCASHAWQQALREQTLRPPAPLTAPRPSPICLFGPNMEKHACLSTVLHRAIKKRSGDCSNVAWGPTNLPGLLLNHCHSHRHIFLKLESTLQLTPTRIMQSWRELVSRASEFPRTAEHRLQQRFQLSGQCVASLPETLDLLLDARSNVAPHFSYVPWRSFLAQQVH